MSAPLATDLAAVALAPEAGTAAELLDRASSDPRAHGALHPFPTGFEPLDTVLGGGLHVGELVLVGGRPGVGKTVATLQWARTIARAGRRAAFVCYEHSPRTLLTRLLMSEVGDLIPRDDVARAERCRTVVRDLVAGAHDPEDLPGIDEALAAAYASVREYGERLWLLRGSATGTGLQELDALAGELGSDAVLFVDYLQKVAVRPRVADESERVIRVADGLKELALSRAIAVVAVVAADQAGITARRLRIHHLRGSSALAHEADVVLALNEKSLAVSKTHLAYDLAAAASFQQYIVLSVEKNREGPAQIDLELRKDFLRYRFEPRGRFVSERLVDDVLYEE